MAAIVDAQIVGQHRLRLQLHQAQEEIGILALHEPLVEPADGSRQRAPHQGRAKLYATNIDEAPLGVGGHTISGQIPEHPHMPIEKFECGIGCEMGDVTRKAARGRQVVGIENRQQVHVGRHGVEGAVAGGGNPAIGCLDQPDFARFGGDFAHHIAGSIGRAVIDDDDVELCSVALTEQRGQGVLDIGRRVVGCDDDRHFHDAPSAMKVPNASAISIGSALRSMK